MDADIRRELSVGFDRAARSYALSRPGYPDEAVGFLLGGSTGDVLDLGAGSGALTRQLPARGVRYVVAAEPSGALLKELVSGCRTARAAGVAGVDVSGVQAGAERLPFADGSFDVVTVATAFHWFDADRALPEIARVLRTGGRLGLVWNTRAVTEPWTRDFDELLRSAQPAALAGDWGVGSVRSLDTSALFTATEYAEFPHSQPLARTGLLDLVSSRSYVIALDEADRSALLHEVGALFDAAAGAATTLDVPYIAQCWRTSACR